VPGARQRGHATELFGRSGADLLPIFEGGAEGIRKAREEVRQFGTVVSDLDVKRLQDADDAIKRMKASAQGLAVTGSSFFAPVISETADSFRRLLGGATELEKVENQIRILREADNSIPVFFNFATVSRMCAPSVRPADLLSRSCCPRGPHPLRPSAHRASPTRGSTQRPRTRAGPSTPCA
jgi:hypothetical protein